MFIILFFFFVSTVFSRVDRWSSDQKESSVLSRLEVGAMQFSADSSLVEC